MLSAARANQSVCTGASCEQNILQLFTFWKKNLPTRLQKMERRETTAPLRKGERRTFKGRDQIFKGDIFFAFEIQITCTSREIRTSLDKTRERKRFWWERVVIIVRWSPFFWPNQQGVRRSGDHFHSIKISKPWSWQKYPEKLQPLHQLIYFNIPW